MTLAINPALPLDLVAVGSWTCFDHLFRVERLPAPGDTVQITSPIAAVEQVFWGGCAANNVAAAARLGARAALVSVVGRDFRTRGYWDDLAALGVDLSGVVVLEDEQSGHSFLFTDPCGNTICLSALGAAARQEELDPSAAVLAQGKITMLNYRFDRFALAAARIAASAGSLVIASGALSTAPALARELLGVSRLLVCTAHELAALCQELGIGQAALFDEGPEAVVVTMGSAGSRVVTRDGEVDIPAVRPDRLVDTVGAGDAFVGALAAGLAFGQSLPEAARLGAAVASFVVEAVGCQTNLPTYAQALQRLTRAAR